MQIEKTVLHVGCGPKNPLSLDPVFRKDDWKELRLDINPDVKPDIIGTITDMNGVKNSSVHAVYSSQNLEHLFAHEVEIALKEFYRVLMTSGFALIKVPNLTFFAQQVVDGNLENTVYDSPAGPISAIDVLWGFRPSIEKGNHYMAHKTGFTAETLKAKMEACGFKNIIVEIENYNLVAVGSKG